MSTVCKLLIDFISHLTCCPLVISLFVVDNVNINMVEQLNEIDLFHKYNYYVFEELKQWDFN